MMLRIEYGLVNVRIGVQRIIQLDGQTSFILLHKKSFKTSVILIPASSFCSLIELSHCFFASLFTQPLIELLKPHFSLHLVIKPPLLASYLALLQIVF